VQPYALALLQLKRIGSAHPVPFIVMVGLHKLPHSLKAPGFDP
jgi:hypothetical protein